MTTIPLKVFMIAGEASGDQLGAAVLKSLARQSPQPLHVCGVGGPMMMDSGLASSLFPMDELSVMGIFEILPRIPHFLSRINQTVRAIVDFKPDVVITIDSPDFCFRVQKKLKGRVSAKQIHIVAPSVWAWRPERAQKISQFLDGLICLLPFEPPYFTHHGLDAIAIGHPVVDKFPDRELLPQKHKRLLVGLYLGSRAGAVAHHAPAFVAAMNRLATQVPKMDLIVPTFDHLLPAVHRALKPLKIPYTTITSETQRTAIMPQLDLALAVSGTIGLELAVAGVPHVIGYKMGGLTYLLARRMVRPGQRAHLANIILDRDVVPEMIQDRCTPDLLSALLVRLATDPAARGAQTGAFHQVRAALGAGEAVSPGDKAARYVLDFVADQSIRIP